MRFLYAASLSLTLGLAIAAPAPAEVDKRDPSNAPINVSLAGSVAKKAQEMGC